MATLLVVALYLMSVFAVALTQTETGSDAAAGTKGFYTYKITPSGAVTIESGIESKTPTNVGVNSATVSSGWATDEEKNMGSWTFDTVTGIGPFNSFYAAFDSSTGKFLGKLNPYNLANYLDTSKGSTDGSENIMWVLPTVYWKTDSNGDLYLTNDPAAGGVAYAHRIGVQDGNGDLTYQTYQYLAIGVYEASGDATALYSRTNQSTTVPTVSGAKSMTLGQIKNAMYRTITTDDSGGGGISMLWNFYQYSLYKYCVAAVIGGFMFTNVGTGPAAGNVKTGSLDSKGPYAHASDGGSMKLFIENVWGGGADAIGDAYIDGRGHLLTVSDPSIVYTYAAGSLTSIKKTAEVTDTNVVFPAEDNSSGKGWSSLNGYVTAISTEADAWGLPTSTDTTEDAQNTMGYAYSSPKMTQALLDRLNENGLYENTSTGEEYYAYASQLNIFYDSYNVSGSHDGVNQLSGYWWHSFTGIANQVGRLAFVYSQKVEEVSQTETVDGNVKTWKIAENATGGICMYLPEPRNGVAGYTFSGWYSKNTYEDEYKVGEPGDPWILSTDNAKLYGKWEEALPTTKEFRVILKETEDGQDKITVHLEAPDGWGGLEAGKVTIGGTYYRVLDDGQQTYGQILGVEAEDLNVQSLAWISSQDLEFTLPEGWNAYLIYAEYEVTDKNAAHSGQKIRTAYVLAGDSAVARTS